MQAPWPAERRSRMDRRDVKILKGGFFTHPVNTAMDYTIELITV
jgi:hypothetical protein